MLLMGFLGLGALRAEPGTPPWFLAPWAQTFAKDPRAASLEWFDQARLGLFIHWGVWGPKHAAWSMYYDKIPLAEYQALARNLDASGFDARAIVKLAKDGGMKYITFVAKHHDGFCLWDSRATGFDSMDYPVHRDFLKELSQACREGGIPLFVYYSLGIDWTHPDFMTRRQYVNARPDTADAGASAKDWTPARFENYRAFCKAQLTELCTGYGDLAGFWFDPLGGVIANAGIFKAQEFYDTIHAIQPHALILFKSGITGTEDVLVGERELASISMHYGGKSDEQKRIRAMADASWQANRDRKAEIAVTSQGTWEWTPKAECRPASELYQMLEHASRNNANLLLNFGPRVNGSIPDDVATEFHALGERIRKDGYPTLNRETWKQLRGADRPVDTKEEKPTAR